MVNDKLTGSGNELASALMAATSDSSAIAPPYDNDAAADATTAAPSAATATPATLSSLPSPFPDDGPLVGTEAMLSSPRVYDPACASSCSNGNVNVNVPVPVPSVYTDHRGSIINVSVGGDEERGGGGGRGEGGQGQGNESQERRRGMRLNLLHTKAGAMRSGDIHPQTQCDFIFRGSAYLWTLDKGGDGLGGSGGGGTTTRRLVKAKEYVEIPPYVPHVFEFLEDTVMAEWWEPQDDGGFRAWYYRPYREIVDGARPTEKEVEMISTGEKQGEGEENDDFEQRNDTGTKGKGRLVALREVGDDEKEDTEALRKKEEEEKWKEIVLGCYTALAIGALSFVAGVVLGYRGRGGR